VVLGGGRLVSVGGGCRALDDLLLIENDEFDKSIINVRKATGMKIYVWSLIAVQD
jgi:hypothetical protein